MSELFDKNYETILRNIMKSMSVQGLGSFVGRNSNNEVMVSLPVDLVEKYPKDITTDISRLLKEDFLNFERKLSIHKEIESDLKKGEISYYKQDHKLGFTDPLKFETLYESAKNIITSLLDDTPCFEVKRSGVTAFTVHPSTKDIGLFQLTFYDAKGDPVSDLQCTKKDLVRELINVSIHPKEVLKPDLSINQNKDMVQNSNMDIINHILNEVPSIKYVDPTVIKAIDSINKSENKFHSYSELKSLYAEKGKLIENKSIGVSIDDIEKFETLSDIMNGIKSAQLQEKNTVAQDRSVSKTISMQLEI